ncbi:MAG TPA: glycosyltransferase [Balneolales bacterium]|nr:glycosyltransferase [Balneolales bacterium]
MKKYLSLYGGEFIVIKNKLNPNASFHFEESAGIRLYDHEYFSPKSLLEFSISENPDLVYVVGWTQKDYLKIARYFFKKKKPVICGVDNPWKNTMRQKYGSIYSNLFLTKTFTHIWIPGKPQYRFALKLGFSPDRILQGLYSADYDYLYNEYKKHRIHKAREFPHRFIYVGRYLEFKGLKELWEAFAEFYEEAENKWELWCLGEGELFPERKIHPHIRHIGFVQPTEIPNYFNDTGAFVLASHCDHWGVVVHEFASAGYPLICSKGVGAATQFLENGINGYHLQPYSIPSIKNSLLMISRKSDEELLRMGDISVEKARSLTPEDWAKTLRNVFYVNA